MYNIITIGCDCSPAAALRNVGLRQFALPFDWVVSSINSLEQCLSENFVRFHTNLRCNESKKRLIDAYGFEFPHDYPLTTTTNIDMIGKGVYGEQDGSTICDNWMDYYQTVKEKYDRRMERFLSIVRDDKPIIIMCRYNTINEIIRLQELFKKLYQKTNIFFINSSSISSWENVTCINTEQNGIWNETALWKDALDMVINDNHLTTGM
jgi:hypothetical protein